MNFQSYKVHTKHRGGTPTKDASKWSVDAWTELQLFALAQARGWRTPNDDILWSIYHDGTNVCHIGNDTDDVLYIAKFWTKNLEWHGFPVYPLGKNDTPPEAVLNQWLQQDLISKLDKRRIKGGRF